MTVYQVDTSKFRVEKQEDTFLCWAASTKSIVEYFGLGTPTQQGLAALYGNKTSGADPRKALAEHFNLNSVPVIEWKTKETSATGIKDRGQDLRDNLKAYLSAKTGPMLCGLTEADDAAWSITNKQGKSQLYTFKHATIVFKYDDASDEVSFMDPARSDLKGKEVAAKVTELVSGFPYASPADLGPNAATMLPPNIGQIRVRLYLLAYFMK